MRINNITPSQQPNKSSKNVSYKGGREILRAFADPDSLISTVALEGFVTGGRSCNAYKRGGVPEFRESLTDNLISAFFWMKGVDIFNKLGDKFGQHVLKLKTTEFDVGKDALRTPFNNLISDIAEEVSDPKTAKAMEKKLATFKFTKIMLSTVAATIFVGFILPKINQAITRKMMAMGKNKNKKEENTQNNTNVFTSEFMKQHSFEAFDKKISQQKDTKNKPSFTGISPSTMTTIAHYLENNKICKMLSCDTGILSGRMVTSRNEDEAIEFLFRDASSSFFYFASTPLVYKGLQMLTRSSALTDVDAVAAKQVNNKLVELLKDANGNYGQMNTKEFTEKAIGMFDDAAKALFDKLPFNSDVISLAELKKHITDENLLKKAEEMAKLQPKQAGIGSVLTKQQVSDVFKNGVINTPEFMQTAYTSKFGDALTNPYKFIPMNKITSFRTNIDNYAQKIIDIANKKNGGIIDKKLLDAINKKSFVMSASFRFIATAFSALALGVVIPKIQYAITAKRTGSNDAPGLREFKEDSKKSTQA